MKSNSDSRPAGLDIIFIREFKVDTVIGVYPAERVAPQSLRLDLEIGTPRNRACATDQLSDTVDYGAVVETIRQSLSKTDFELLEALTEHVAGLVLEKFGAAWVRVEAAKNAILPDVRFVGVSIERSRSTQTPWGLNRRITDSALTAEELLGLHRYA